MESTEADFLAGFNQGHRTFSVNGEVVRDIGGALIVAGEGAGGVEGTARGGGEFATETLGVTGE